MCFWCFLGAFLGTVTVAGVPGHSGHDSGIKNFGSERVASLHSSLLFSQTVGWLLPLSWSLEGSVSTRFGGGG